MCGGAGTRLWPASRENRPKQFLPLLGMSSTFQETIKRVSDSRVFDRPIVVTNTQYRSLVAEQLRELSAEADILLEPVRRDSGPAFVLGAAQALRRDPDAIVVALASDHVVFDVGAFVEACTRAAPAASDNRIVLFGVNPTRPAPEYGYIQPGPALSSVVFAVHKFAEKPNVETAAQYIEQGYLWNSGNFAFRAGFLLEEYQKHEPESAVAIQSAFNDASVDLGFTAVDQTQFARAAAKSIDYAVIERTDRAAVIPVSCGWSDLGSWQAVWELSEHDLASNASRGPAIFVGSHQSYATSGKQMVAVLGLDNVVVAATDDVVLVAPRENANGMRDLVQEVKALAPALTVDHLNVHRPWGSYQSLDQGSRYQVKRIVVKQGGRLSLQMHHHRAEHWVIVRGTAKVTIENTERLLYENESIYVSEGCPTSVGKSR